MTSKVYQINDKEFKGLIKKSNSYSDVLRALGLNTKGGSSTDILKKRIRELNCSISHFNKNTKTPSNIKYSLDEILVENSTYTNIERLKERLIRENRLEYKCAICGNIGIWNGQKLTLQLDHINGIHNDHRIENLRFLCPNCHSATETYAGKNVKHNKKKYLCIDCGKEISKTALRCVNCAKIALRKVERPSLEQLKDDLKHFPCTKVGKKYNVSDTTIKKWLKYYEK